MSLKFLTGEPPRTKSSGTRWAAVRAELRDHPGQWAEVARFPKGENAKASNTRQAITGRFPDLEGFTRTDGDEVVVYARAAVAS